MHPAFKMRTTKEIVDNLVFLEKLPNGIVGYTINGTAVKDSWKKIRVYFNGNKEKQTIAITEVGWNAAIVNNQLLVNENISGSLILQPYSCTILYTE